MSIQLYETPHKIPPGLYRKQFIQHGGMPHFSGRIHVRPYRGMGLTGGSFFSKLAPIGHVIKKLGRTILPIGKEIVKKIGPKLLESAAVNAHDVMSGKKKILSAVKDTVLKNKNELIGDVLEVASRHARKRQHGKGGRRSSSKRRKIHGGGVMSINRARSALARGQLKKTNYMYGDVFDRLSK